MPIKVKLIMSNIIMVIISVVLSALLLVFIGNHYSKKVETSYNLDMHKRNDLLSNPYLQLKDINMKNFNEIKLAISRNPDLLKDNNYLNGLNQLFKKGNSFIVVREENNIIFQGQSGISSLINKLPEFNFNMTEKGNGVIVDNNDLVIKQMDFLYRDKERGTIFTITDTTNFYKIIREYVIVSIVSLITIISAISGIFTFFTSRSIIKPLDSLKIGTEKIKDGDLDFEVKATSGDEIGELCVAFDDMRKKLKESIEVQAQYENNRKELISNISHDLKTPITSIKGYVEGIKDGVPDTPEKMNKYINTIYSKAKSMDKLIDELFLYSKLDLNKIPFNFEIVNMVPYLSDIAEEFQFDLEKKNIDIKFYNEAGKTAKVLIDGQKINRVMTNIIGNSIKYMDKPNGEINIKLSKKDKNVIVNITDNGKGIPKDDIPFIFDRFYRADSSRNTVTGGSGLGLAICMKIIEEHNGRIWAESSENMGTSITFILSEVI
ncbi:MAG: sensory transduction histidine kinase [Clostridiaceae bacterium]|jgi:signal transduction histidine kinase|nr:sensory transduction histidine kinase [Clostridiaceae bacterium]